MDALRAAIKYYERVIPGFLKDGNLVGVETRVSSPVRFERNPETLASSLPGLYLAGEGAGMPVVLFQPVLMAALSRGYSNRRSGSEGTNRWG